MSKSASTHKAGYAQAVIEFRSDANTILASAYRVVKGNIKPELNPEIISVALELENILSALDKRYKPCWKEMAEKVSPSLQEMKLAVNRLKVTGQKLQLTINESWPVKDDLAAFLGRLQVFINLIEQN